VKIGKKRIRLAKLLEEAFSEIGMTVKVDPEDLRPALGYWRTDHRADVYRWEGWAKTERSYVVGINSWHTMTELIAAGIKVERVERVGRMRSFEAFPRSVMK